MLYMLIVSLAAFFAGSRAIKYIEMSGNSRWVKYFGQRFTHNSLYSLVSGSGSVFDFDSQSPDHTNDYVMAAVLTDIGYGNRSLVYYGAVQDLVISGLNTVECITLKEPDKFLLKLKDDTAETPSRSHYVKVFDGKNIDDNEKGEGIEIAARHMTIYKSSIKNITYERFNFKIGISTSEESEQDLENLKRL